MATIRTPSAGVSPYQGAAAAEPAVLTTTVNGRPSTLAASTIVNGEAALNRLITTGQTGVFQGANVTINLEEQNFSTTNQVTSNTNYPSGNTGEIQYNSGANSFASDPYFTYTNSNVLTPGIRTDGYFYANGFPFIGGGNAAIGNFVFTGDTVTISDSNQNMNITGNGTGNIRVNSNGNIWTFNNVGNLTLPSNSSSINYANGSPYGGGNYSNSNVSSFLAAFGSNVVSTTGNITGGNLTTTGTANVASLAVTGSATVQGSISIFTTSTSLSAAGNIIGSNFIVSGVLVSTNTVSATGNVTANNGMFTTAVYVPTVSTLSGNLNLISAPSTNIVIDAGNGTGNINLPAKTANTILFVNADKNMKSSANLQYNGTSVIVNGEISATGNITGNYFIGNGSQLTGIAVSYGNANVVANLAALGSNPVSTTGNVTGGNLLFGAGIVSGTGNITGGNLSGTSITGTLTTGTQSAITSVGTLTNISTSGNANVTGNVNSARVSATGNITAGNILTGGLISVAGNITAGNLDAVNLVINSITSDDSSFVTIEDGLNVTSGLISSPESMLLSAGANTWTFGSNSKITLPNGASLNDTSGDSVAFGQSAGLTSQAQHAVAIGINAGRLYQGEDSVAIGYNAGYYDQQRGVAIGWDAGEGGTLTKSVSDAQGGSGPVHNYVSGDGNPTLTLDSVVNVNVNDKVFGNNIPAGAFVASINAPNINISAPPTAALTAGDDITFVSLTLGLDNASNIVVGMRATGTDIPANTFVQNTGCSIVELNQYPTAPLTDGATIVFSVGQGFGATAIGYQAGSSFQDDNAVAVGRQAGYSNQGANAVAIGAYAGYTQSANAVAVGTYAGFSTQNINAVAVGYKAGQNSQGARAVAIGEDAASYAQGNLAVAIGQLAGNTSQGANSVAIGANAAANVQGNNSVAVGWYAGYDTQGADAVAVGQGAGYQGQGIQAVAIGPSAAAVNQGAYAISIGAASGNGQGNAAVAIGGGAGYSGQGANTVALGRAAGAISQGVQSVAVGNSAGYTGQGTAAVAIGAGAGYTNQGNNSIILNATAANLNQTTANTFTVAPVRNDVANIAEIVFYNTTSKEITYGNVISVAGNITGGNLTVGSGTITSGNVNANNVTVTTAVYVPTVSTLSGNLNLISAPSTNIVIDAGNGTGNINLPAKTANTILFVNADKNMKSSANLQYNGTSVIVNGEISATGNITAGNILTGGLISATGNITGGNILTGGAVKTGVFVTGTIPSASGAGAGARAFVTDADSITFGNLYTGSSGNAMPVFSNGTSWFIG